MILESCAETESGFPDSVRPVFRTLETSFPDSGDQFSGLCV